MQSLLETPCSKCDDESGLYFCTLCVKHYCIEHLCQHLEKSQEKINQISSFNFNIDDSSDDDENNDDNDVDVNNNDNKNNNAIYVNSSAQKKLINNDLSSQSESTLQKNLSYHLKQARLIQKELERRMIGCSSFSYELERRSKSSARNSLAKTRATQSRQQKKIAKVTELLKFLIQHKIDIKNIKDIK